MSTTAIDERRSSWIGEHRSKWGLGLRITVAALLTFALGQLVGLPQVYWAVLSAVIVLQSSVGGSVKATFDRLGSTLGGAVWAVVVILLTSHLGYHPVALVLGLTVAPLAVLSAFRPRYRVAPVTAVIVLLGSSGDPAGALGTGLHRVLDIGFGCLVALAVALLVLPARASSLLEQSTGRILDLMGQYLEISLADLSPAAEPEMVTDLRARIRSEIARAEGAAEEARRERLHHLADAPDPEPTVRTMRRLKNDLDMISRATADPFPEPVRARLRASATALSAAVRGFLHCTAEATARHSARPSLLGVQQALAGYEDTMAGIRTDGLTRDLPVEAVSRIFGLSFALEQLARDLADLTDGWEELPEGSTGDRHEDPA